MWITPPFVATPTIHNPQPPVDNLEGAVNYLYAQPLIHKLSTTNPQGYPQGYPHDPAHRVGLESRPGANHQTPTPPHTPPTPKGADTTTPHPTHYHGTHAMDHQQPTRTTPKKLEPTQKTNTANNKRKMRGPRNPGVGPGLLDHRTPGHPLRRPPVAPHQLHDTRHRHRPYPTRGFKRPDQPPTPVPPMPRLQDRRRGPRHTHTHDTHANTTNTATPMRQTTKQNKNKMKRKQNESKRNAEPKRRTRNLKRKQNPLQKNDRHPWR